MKNENNDMITKFKYILEKNVDLTDIVVEVQNEKTELIDKIKHELSIITYKRAKNPKSIRIVKISGFFNKRDLKNIKLLYSTYLIIDLSNGDKINGELSVYQDENENNINIKINGELVYDLDNNKFNNDLLIDKITEKYKEYLLKKYKIIR